MRYLFLILFYFLAASFSAQVEFYKVPSTMQMFPRGDDNLGHFVVEGIAEKTLKIHSLLTEAPGHHLYEHFYKLVESGGTFTFNHKIPARLAEFDLTIYAEGPGGEIDTLCKKSGLLAGDFCIVGGQSNAECGWDSDAE